MTEVRGIAFALARKTASTMASLAVGVGVDACAAPPTPAAVEVPPLTACAAVPRAVEPRLALLGCATEELCDVFVSRGVTVDHTNGIRAVSCEARLPLGSTTAPVFRVRLQTTDVYDSIVLYRATWEGDRWIAEAVDEATVLPRGRTAVRLVTPPAFSFELGARKGSIRERAPVTTGPFLLSPFDRAQLEAEDYGESLWLAPDLRWWARRNEPGFEAFRVVLNQSLGPSFLFEGTQDGDGARLVGQCSCGTRRSWRLSNGVWTAFRGRAAAILEAEQFGGDCGRDGYGVTIEAAIAGRWRVVYRACDDVGGFLAALRSQKGELVRACEPKL